jgi:hypothetical protein
MFRQTRNSGKATVRRSASSENENNDHEGSPASAPSWETINGSNDKGKRKADEAFQEDKQEDGEESLVLLERDDVNELEEIVISG